MNVRALLGSVDRFQQRHQAVAIPVAALKKFADDGAGNAAALIAYFGFFSLFPLLLLFVTILGFVLQGDPAATQAVLKSALHQFPVVGVSLDTSHPLHGSPVALTIGAIGALLAGLGVAIAAENAFNVVYEVPRDQRPSFFATRLRALKLLAVVGLLQLLSTAVSGAVSGGVGGFLMTILAIAIALLLNLLLFFAVFRLLTVRQIATRQLWPGIALSAVLWLILQAVGGAYIGHVVKGAGETYGTFATVIGLLVWLYLGARVVVYSAELNTVLTRRLWPRSLLGPATAADQHARAGLGPVAHGDDRRDLELDRSFHPTPQELPVQARPASVSEPARPFASPVRPGAHVGPNGYVPAPPASAAPDR